MKKVFCVASLFAFLFVCMAPVLAQDASHLVDGGEIEYLCEVHCCLRPKGIDDAVCASCFFGTCSASGFTDLPEDIPDVSLQALDSNESIQYVYDTAVYHSPDGDRLVARWFNWVDGETCMDLTRRIPDLRFHSSTRPEDGYMYSFSYSPTREAYYVQLATPASNLRMTLMPWADNSVGYYVPKLMPNGTTYNLVFRATDSSSGGYGTPTAVSMVQCEYNIYHYRNVSNTRAAFWIGRPTRINNYSIANSIAGYYNLWFGKPTFDVPILGDNSPDNYLNGNPEYGPGYIAAPPRDVPYPTRVSIGLSVPCDLFEVKRFLMLDRQYDVVSGEYPSEYPNGGYITGVTYPNGDGSWEDQQFQQGVSPELSGTASSATDGINNITSYESQVGADLDKYLNESGIQDYAVPSDLTSAFSWVSNRFTSFIDAHPQLKVVVLFPVYLGVVVAILHGLEFAGRSINIRGGGKRG